jgi:hypothetical protein
VWSGIGRLCEGPSGRLRGEVKYVNAIKRVEAIMVGATVPLLRKATGKSADQFISVHNNYLTIQLQCAGLRYLAINK